MSSFMFVGFGFSQISRTVSRSSSMPSRHLGYHGPTSQAGYKHGADRK